MTHDLGNQAAPAGVARGRASWREDLAAYDLLPEQLREMVQAAPFEIDAVGVLAGLEVFTRRYGSRAMAIAMIAAELSRFIAGVLDGARAERERGERPRGWSGPKGSPSLVDCGILASSESAVRVISTETPAIVTQLVDAYRALIQALAAGCDAAAQATERPETHA